MKFDAYSDDSWSGRFGERPCMSCGRPHLHLVDGWCPQCAGITPQFVSPERERQERARLFRSTAKVLREIGRADRAEWYEEQIALLEPELVR